jgi:hypothetical protein
MHSDAFQFISIVSARVVAHMVCRSVTIGSVVHGKWTIVVSPGLRNPRSCSDIDNHISLHVSSGPAPHLSAQCKPKTPCEALAIWNQRPSPALCDPPQYEPQDPFLVVIMKHAWWKWKGKSSRTEVGGEVWVTCCRLSVASLVYSAGFGKLQFGMVEDVRVWYDMVWYWYGMMHGT